MGVAVVPRAQIVVVELEGGPARLIAGTEFAVARCFDSFASSLLTAGAALDASRRLEAAVFDSFAGAGGVGFGLGSATERLFARHGGRPGHDDRQEGEQRDQPERPRRAGAPARPGATAYFRGNHGASRHMRDGM